MRDRLVLSKEQFKSLWMLKVEAHEIIDMDPDVSKDGYTSIADSWSFTFVWDEKHDDPAFTGFADAEDWALTHINTERHVKS